jgi:hypothetical protein
MVGPRPVSSLRLQRPLDRSGDSVHLTVPVRASLRPQIGLVCRAVESMRMQAPGCRAARDMGRELSGAL